MRWESVDETRSVKVPFAVFEITDIEGNSYALKKSAKPYWTDYKYGPRASHFNVKKIFENEKLIDVGDNFFLPMSSVLSIGIKTRGEEAVEVVWTHRGFKDWCWLEWVLHGFVWFLMLGLFAILLACIF